MSKFTVSFTNYAGKSQQNLINIYIYIAIKFEDSHKKTSFQLVEKVSTLSSFVGKVCLKVKSLLKYLSSLRICKTGLLRYIQSWALSVFFHFFNNKKWFFCIFFQVYNLLLHQSYLKSPLPAKLTWWKMQKIIFYHWKN